MAFDFTGAWTLSEASKYASTPLLQGMLETLTQESPLLEQLPFMTIQGNAVGIQVEGDLPSVSFRNVNEEYTRSFGSDTDRLFGVAILGGEVFVDNFLLKTVANEVDVKAMQYAKFAKAMSRQFDKSFFDGTGTAKDFVGINALITDGLGQSLQLASGGAALTLDDLDEAQELMRVDTPSAWLMNRTMRRRITIAGRNISGGFALIDMGTDVFGRLVTQYNGVPFRIIGDAADGTAILGFDEDDGASNFDTTSVYGIKYGVGEGVMGIQGAGGSLEVQDFGELQTTPGHLGRVEWYPGVAIYNPYSVVRISRINNA